MAAECHLPGTDPQKHKWMIMLYMQASDTSNLDSVAVQDLLELQQAIQGTKDPAVRPNVNVTAFVQMKRRWPDLPQRYVIDANREFIQTRNSADEADMATRSSLECFLAEGRHLGDERNVTNYCLVLWGHNFGLGFGRDHGDALTVKDLALALSSQFGGSNAQLDLLATNSCTMAYVEAAFELQKPVKYLVASQVFMPAKGFPYRSIVRSVGDRMGAEQLGRAFVDEYLSSFGNSPNGEKVALSLLDLSGTEKFAGLLQETAEAVQVVIKRGANPIAQQKLREIQDVFMVNPAGDPRPVLDLNGLAQNLLSYCEDSGVLFRRASITANDREALLLLAKAGLKLERQTQTIGDPPPARDSLMAMVSKGFEAPPVIGEPSLVVVHKEHPDLGPLGGIGVFVPFVVDGATRKQLELASKDARDLYRSLNIFEDDTKKRWPELVDDTLRRDEPDEIVSATGVVLPADRVQVNQMVGAVDAAFNTLDRVLESTEDQLVEVLGVKSAQEGKLLPFGPPYLKLSRNLSLQPQADGRPKVSVSEEIVRTFQRIERSLGLVERTVKHVMTNSSFGLGPPVKSDVGALGPKQDIGALGPKQDIGALGPKQDIGALGPKQDIGALGPKQDIGALGPNDVGALWGAITAFLSSDSQVALLSLRVLYRALACVLGELETAVSDLELAAAQCRLEPHFAQALSAEEYKDAMEQRFGRLFAVAAEASLIARRTTRTIMAHPVYGLGRGPEDFGQVQRDQLAVTAGLSRSQLALL